MGIMFWTDEEKTTALRMYTEGSTFREIAEALPHRSYSAVHQFFWYKKLRANKKYNGTAVFGFHRFIRAPIWFPTFEDMDASTLAGELRRMKKHFAPRRTDANWSSTGNSSEMCAY